MNNIPSQNLEQRTELSGFIIERTAKRMKQSFQQMLKDLGVDITVDQWVILKLLDREDGLSQFEIAQKTYKDRPTVTRIIDLLCKKNLLERRADPNDRRRFNIFLKKAGKEMIQLVIPNIKHFRKKSWKGINEEDISSVMRILNTIFDNLESNQ